MAALGASGAIPGTIAASLVATLEQPGTLTTPDSRHVLPTVSALRDADRAGLAKDDLVAVLGYYYPNDAAGLRFYRLRKNSTLADDGGTVVRPTGAGMPGDRWELLWDGSELSVCWYGAKPDYDGTSWTDNQAYFEAARQALDPLRGGTLWVPVGSYAFSTTWNWGEHVRLVFRGMGAQMSSEDKDELRGSTLVWTGAPDGDMIQVNPTASSPGDVRHSGPHFHNLNLISHVTQAGRAVYVRATTGSRFYDCVVRDFGVGLEFDSQEASSGGEIEAGDAAWTVIDGLHEYDCDKGIFVPYTAGLRIINGKFAHGAKVDQWAVYVTSGPQILVAHNKFDSLGQASGGGCYLGGQFSQFHGNQVEDCNPGVRIGAGPHADDGYGNDVSHNRFRNLAGVTAIDIAGEGRVRYTTLIGNVFKGGGTNIDNGGSGTYRRDALAPNG